MVLLLLLFLFLVLVLVLLLVLPPPHETAKVPPQQSQLPDEPRPPPVHTPERRVPKASAAKNYRARNQARNDRGQACQGRGEETGAGSWQIIRRLVSTLLPEQSITGSFVAPGHSPFAVRSGRRQTLDPGLLESEPAS
ncbi:hypothetical protein QBC33DRAFT_510475 [Phialemonium atrogriseum]|uniref:Secreted protein n=1 Tax=Phialemonium atrogriseum TaxID=1093897 RepID=A0AAJ0CE35_9PEZI|nr:uncharacterized protein QBC33DRAFT_510475 [Phialemonium atrogriseum]KAK1772626.1 hypothetical protein QBC33DRAFT_510475 [Phialemonium atrogriseum]